MPFGASSTPISADTHDHATADGGNVRTVNRVRPGDDLLGAVPERGRECETDREGEGGRAGHVVTGQLYPDPLTLVFVPEGHRERWPIAE